MAAAYAPPMASQLLKSSSISSLVCSKPRGLSGASLTRRSRFVVKAIKADKSVQQRQSLLFRSSRATGKEIHRSKMPVSRIAIGSPGELSHPDTFRAGVAEFICMLIFVFAGSGSGMAFAKLTGGGPTTPAGLIAAALAYALSLIVAVSVGANISGGHVNPAVTFGAFVGGNISLFKAVVYWVAQLLGSVVACLLLKFATGGQAVGAFALSAGVGVWNAVVFEIVMTFGLVYTVYATAVDPKKGAIGTIAPIAIGFIVGANILAGGAFSGASMNPAVTFGPAVVTGVWENHWVYWLGPFIGAAIAALIYKIIFIGQRPHEQLPTADY